MQTKRLLLPFTHAIDSDALEHALRLAKGTNATLIALALVQVPEGCRSKGARLEHIQQAKDFLEAVKHKAVRYAVAVERFEVFTADAMQSIDAIAQTMECEGVLLFVRGGSGVLLSAEDIKRLVTMETRKLYLMRMPSSVRKNVIQLLGQRFANWMPDRRRQQLAPVDAQWERGDESDRPVEEAEQLVGEGRHEFGRTLTTH